MKESEYPPLEAVTRPYVPTKQAAYNLLRSPQTLRAWACRGYFPLGVRSRNLNGRLAWPVSEIERALACKPVRS